MFHYGYSYYEITAKSNIGGNVDVNIHTNYPQPFTINVIHLNLIDYLTRLIETSYFLITGSHLRLKNKSVDLTSARLL